MQQPADDIAVIQQVLQGQQTAYAILVERYQQYVFTLAMRYVNNREVAEELSQDVFVKAYRYLADFKGHSKFSTWLYTIVNTTCLSYLRKKKEETILLEEERMIAITDNRNEAQPPGKMEMAEQKGMLNKAIAALPEEDGRILSLFYIAEQSIEETGIIMGLTSGNVKIRLFRARQKLKEIVARNPELTIRA
jgi:RNA polymerase sigma factor (sigma-70 family)